jgi:DNA-binding CsgD family transcriptional regulator
MANEKTELTKRELQVVALIGQDKKYKEIAEELELGYETVKTYAARIRKKLGVGSKVAVALWAQQHGLITNEAQKNMDAMLSEKPWLAQGNKDEE